MLAIYSPEVPPRPGGVSDQTLALARALDRLGRAPLVLAARGAAGPFGPVTCVTGIAPLDAPAAAAARGAHRLLVQYVPFLYARLGIAPALRHLPDRCRTAGVALDLFVHEPWVPFTRLPWLLTGIPQRWQLRTLARGARRIYTPVPDFADRLRLTRGVTAGVTVAPVGASLEVADAGCRDAARARLGLAAPDVAIGVFSPGASGFLARWVRDAAARLAGVGTARWVLFGSGSGRFEGMPASPQPIVVAETDPIVIAETMRAMDIAAQPYVDGLTLRRTGAMLALASGVATVSSTGPLYDPVAGALALCEPDAGAFGDRIAELVRDPAAKGAAARRTAGYGATASAEALARMLIADDGA